MPRHIRDTRPVVRTVTTLHTHETLVVKLAPEGILFREPRKRTWYTLPYGRAFVDAVHLFVESTRATRRPRGRVRARRLARS